MRNSFGALARGDRQGKYKESFIWRSALVGAHYFPIFYSRLDRADFGQSGALRFGQPKQPAKHLVIMLTDLDRRQ